MSALERLDDIRDRMDVGEVIPEADVVQIMEKLMELLYLEDNIVVTKSPAVIVGDIHGQYEDLVDLLEEADFDRKRGTTRFVFMGDYVDRGYYSMNTFLLLAIMKIQNPENVILLRGNHESRQVSMQYGFRNETIANYGHAGVWMLTMNVFDLLPLGALIDNEVFSVHGGLSPKMPYIELAFNADRKGDIPETGFISELLWSDPDQDLDWWRPNDRGAGYKFGYEAAKEFCYLNRLKLVTRSHQLVQDGWEYCFEYSRDPLVKELVVNVWSAPNYCYRSGNEASFMTLENGEWDFTKFRERPQNMRIKQYDMKPSTYFA